MSPFFQTPNRDFDTKSDSKEPWDLVGGCRTLKPHFQKKTILPGSIDESDKLQYVKYIADIPTQEGRNAELALFQRRQEDAEQILLQAWLPMGLRTAWDGNAVPCRAVPCSGGPPGLRVRAKGGQKQPNSSQKWPEVAITSRRPKQSKYDQKQPQTIGQKDPNSAKKK